MKLNIFHQTNLLAATKALFANLKIPVNYVADEPTTAQEILQDTYKENDTFQLINNVYFVGMVDDAAFNKTESIAKEKIKSDYDGILLFAITLHERNNGLLPARSQLAEISRAFNREFYYTPVIIVFKYRDNKSEYIAFSNTERLQYKQAWREGEKAGKVSLLRDINIAKPHAGHERIIDELRIPTSGKNTVDTFDKLYKYWQEVFSVSILNKKFYQELQSWYFWAIKEVRFPNAPGRLDINEKGEYKYDSNSEFDEAVNEHKAKNVIRLLTRILFIWFIKEKKLIPEEIFDDEYIVNNLLKNFTPQKPHGVFATGKNNSMYYRAILQNLFFATLNQEMGKREFRKPGAHQNVTNLMRYKDYFKDGGAEKFIALMESQVPFMNGGLFECLDKPHPDVKGKQGGDLIIYEDGFSDRTDNEVEVPDYLFFDVDEEVDISDDIGSTSKIYKQAKTKGLLELLKSYKFTITENTPIEEDVALDPELLGKVFENLLASYNPETKTTARKQTGSFYTPREIVNYMVDESLIAYLKNAITNWNGLDEKQVDDDLHTLISFDNPQNPFSDTPALQTELIKALDTCKILDPACGSGAFPMGILQKMVHTLYKVDPNNSEWKQRQIDRVDKAIEQLENIDDVDFRNSSIKELEAQKADIEESFNNNELDYGRKLYLIENCIYGVDIQSIATQISKLRFFISLVVDQKIDKNKPNFGVRPLPNLETKFVAANTLIGIEKTKEGDFTGSIYDDKEVKQLENKLKKVRHKLFSSKSPKRKRELREEDKLLRDQISHLLEDKHGWANETARQLASWDPYDQNASSSFFDPEWMFDISNGFDVVIGNPPYINANELKKRLGKTLYESLKSGFESAKGTIDIYILFFEFGLKSLTEKGHLIYITPNRYLSASYGEALRDFIYRDYSIKRISDYSSVRVFEAASTYPIVTLLAKGKSTNPISIRKFNSDYTIENSWKNEYADLDLLPGKIWGFLLNSKIDIVKRIISVSARLSDCGVINATSTAKEADEFHSLINEKSGLKLINTGTIDKYTTLWGKSMLTDKGVTYLEPYLNTSSSIVSAQRKKLYENTKIIIAKIGLSAEALFDEHGEFASINTNCIHSFKTGYDPKYITLWLNSLLYNFLFSCFFDGLRMAGGYLLFSSPNLKSTYIRRPSDYESNIATILHDLSKFFCKSNNSNWLSQIADSFIFNLYFPEHMQEKGIDVIQFVEQDLNDVLKDRDFEQLPDGEKTEVIETLHKKWTHPDNEVRNRIKLFAVRSPEILKPILES